MDKKAVVHIHNGVLKKKIDGIKLCMCVGVVNGVIK